jgi:hypothetical protein
MSQAGKFGSSSGPITPSVLTLTGDTGGPISPDGGGNINIETGYTSGPLAQGTAEFSGSGNTLSLTFTDPNANTGIGVNALKSIAINSAGNTAVGSNAGISISGSGQHCLFGVSSGISLIGAAPGAGGGNHGFGQLTLYQLIDGVDNIAIGDTAGGNLINDESCNIYLNNQGVVGDNFTLRIGSGTGATPGTQELSNAYISGIDGVNVGSVASVVSISGDHLGSTTITAGSGISVTPGANTITIAATGGGAAGAVTFQAQSGSGGTIPKGTLVYVNGISAGIPLVKEADALSSHTHSPAVGMVLTSVGVGVTGDVQISGLISGIDTSTPGLSIGGIVYMSAAVAGGITATRPTGTNLIQVIGTCVAVDATNGSIILDIPSDVVKVPNVPSNNIWVGNASALPVETALANGVLTYNTTSHAFSGSALTQNSLLYGGASNAISSLGVASNGQIAIGSTGTTPVLATITAGSGISVTNGAGSITIANTSTGMTWSEVTGTSQAMAVNTGYIANNAGLVTLTLPATAAVGDIVRVTGKGAGGWLIAQNSGQTIFFGTSTTTTGVGGSLASTQRRDGVELVCVTANNDWNVLSVQGNLTVV